MRFANIVNPRVARVASGDEFGGGLGGRCVVDHHDLVVRVVDIIERAEAQRQAVATVTSGDDDADQRRVSAGPVAVDQTRRPAVAGDPGDLERGQFGHAVRPQMCVDLCSQALPDLVGECLGGQGPVGQCQLDHPEWFVVQSHQRPGPGIHPASLVVGGGDCRYGLADLDLHHSDRGEAGQLFAHASTSWYTDSISRTTVLA